MKPPGNKIPQTPEYAFYKGMLDTKVFFEVQNF